MISDEFIVAGPRDPSEYPQTSVAQIIIDKLKQHGDTVAFIDGDTEATVTYSKILKKTAQLSSALKRIGLVKNDVVSIISENDMNYIIPYLACLCNGIVVSHLNPEYTSYELAHSIEITKPKLIFCSATVLAAVNEMKQKFDFIHFAVLLSDDCDDWHMNLNYLITVGETWNESFEPMQLNIKEDVACIFMSSGTTGLPKAVMLTHDNIRHILFYTEYKELGFGTGETTLYNLPSFHIFGSLVMLPSIASSTKLIFMKKFKPDKYLSFIEKYSVTRLFLVPPIALFLVKSPCIDKYNLKSIRGIYSGAATLSAETLLALENRLNVLVHQMYGLTETTGMVTYDPRDVTKLGSIGKLKPHTLGKVIDIETGKNLGVGKCGELCFKGDSIMKGYLNNEKATKAIIDENSFLHTGDIGYYDENGYFFIVDRLKDIIKYKGFQVSPSEIEAVLTSHVGVKDAAVVGIEDERTGEKPLAYVVKQPGYQINEKQLIDFVADKLSVQKHLYGGVIFTDEIPKNPSGKILRKILKQYE